MGTRGTFCVCRCEHSPRMLHQRTSVASPASFSHSLALTLHRLNNQLQPSLLDNFRPQRSAVGCHDLEHSAASCLDACMLLSQHPLSCSTPPNRPLPPTLPHSLPAPLAPHHPTFLYTRHRLPTSMIYNSCTDDKSRHDTCRHDTDDKSRHDTSVVMTAVATDVSWRLLQAVMTHARRCCTCIRQTRRQCKHGMQR